MEKKFNKIVKVKTM